MIHRYNLHQTLHAVSYVIAGALCFILAYYFFLETPLWVCARFLIQLSRGHANLIAVICLAMICFSGYRVWRQRGGFSSYHESGLYRDIDTSTGSGTMASHYLHEVTGIAYILS